MAATFDDVTGFVIGRLHDPAFTGELTVRFLRPCRSAARSRSAPVSTAANAGSSSYPPRHTTATRSITACQAIYITVDPSLFAGAPDPR